MATTTERANRVSTTQVGRSPQRWIPWAAGVVAVAVVAVAGTAVWSGRQAAPEAVAVSSELLRQQAMTDTELRQELTEKGLIPMPAVAVHSELLRQQAMSDTELRQELTERGLIPGSAVAVSSELLRQQAMTDTELRQELIDRGLIPMPAVRKAP
ncbi:MAG TPA: hypothetical protein VHM94_13200 [Acidimicrobiia bacterium]|nr:hypothetical protein [Acidimicrobiia bacterium]